MIPDTVRDVRDLESLLFCSENRGSIVYGLRGHSVSLPGSGH